MPVQFRKVYQLNDHGFKKIFSLPEKHSTFKPSSLTPNSHESGNKMVAVRNTDPRLFFLGICCCQQRYSHSCFQREAAFATVAVADDLVCILCGLYCRIIDLPGDQQSYWKRHPQQGGL